MNDRPKLVILDGQIFIEKTPNLFASPKDYLTNWQSENFNPNGTQVRVLTEDLFQDLISLAGDCASDLLASVTEQRDRLAEALEHSMKHMRHSLNCPAKITEGLHPCNCQMDWAYDNATEALQSLT